MQKYKLGCVRFAFVFLFIFFASTSTANAQTTVLFMENEVFPEVRVKTTDESKPISTHDLESRSQEIVDCFSLDRDAKITISDQGSLISFEQLQEINSSQSDKDYASSYIDGERYDKLIEKCVKNGYIPSDYSVESVYNPIDNLVEVRLQPLSKCGIKNPYNRIKIGIDTSNNTIIYFSKVEDFTGEMKPNISAREAEIIARDYLAQNGLGLIQSVELVVKKSEDMNFSDHESEFMLVYDFACKDGHLLIDASTGKVIRFDSYEGKVGRAFYVDDKDGDAHRVRNERATCLHRIMKLLGYKADKEFIQNTKTDSKKIINFLKGYDNYAFSFSGHGGPELICAKEQGSIRWKIFHYQVTGVWNFVFLDACSTGPQPTVDGEYKESHWAQAFSNGGSNQIFLGWNRGIVGDVSLSYLQCLESRLRNHPNETFYHNVWGAINDGPDDYYIGFYGDKECTGRI